MKVIFLKDVVKIGKKYDVKDFADGYAQNVLIAKGLAIRATPQELAKIDARKESILNQKYKEETDFKELMNSIHSVSVIVKSNTNEKGHLFQALPKSDIINSIHNLTSILLEEENIVIEKPIKEIGVHRVKIKKGDLDGDIKITVE